MTKMEIMISIIHTMVKIKEIFTTMLQMETVILKELLLPQLQDSILEVWEIIIHSIQQIQMEK